MTDLHSKLSPSFLLTRFCFVLLYYDEYVGSHFSPHRPPAPGCPPQPIRPFFNASHASFSHPSYGTPSSFSTSSAIICWYVFIAVHHCHHFSLSFRGNFDPAQLLAKNVAFLQDFWAHVVQELAWPPGNMTKRTVSNQLMHTLFSCSLSFFSLSFWIMSHSSQFYTTKMSACPSDIRRCLGRSTGAGGASPPRPAASAPGPWLLVALCAAPRANHARLPLACRTEAKGTGINIVGF